MEKDKGWILRYWPLFALILVALLGASALAHSVGRSLYAWMHFFMGLFFCQFSMLKLFNPAGFASGFQKYDLIAKRFEGYSYFYPLIELGLGLAYLSFVYPIATYVITIIVMSVGAVGVIRALREGLDLRCACMGTVLDVPLSTVTLAEDVVMGVMAFLMLVISRFSAL